jgi:hypothetical protein
MGIADGWLLAAFAAAMALNGLLAIGSIWPSERRFFCQKLNPCE